MRSLDLLHADPRWVAAQRGANRDRRCPIVRPAVLAGHLPDPREVPACRRIITGWHVATALQLAACLGWVACLWWAAS